MNGLRAQALAMWSSLESNPPLMYATLVVAGCVGLVLLLVVRDWISAMRLSGYPGPVGLPIFGHVPWLTSAPWMRFKDWARKYGPAYKMFVWNMPMVVVSSPELSRRIMVEAKRDYPKDNWSYSFFGPILGEGLVTASGEKWKKQNRVLKPKFSHEALRQYMGAFVRAAERLVEQWKKLPEGAAVELDSTFRLVTLEVISEVTLGLTPEDASVLPRLFSDIIDELNTRMWEPWRAFMPVEWKHQHRIAELNKLVLAIIHARKAEYEEAGGVPRGRELLSDEEALAESGSAGADSAMAKAREELGGGDFLDIMLQSDVEFSDQEMLDSLKTMLMAGHETSAMMLTWCTFLLTRDADEMHKAVAEIDEAWAAAAAATGSRAEASTCRFNWAGINRLTKEKAEDGSPRDTYVDWALHEAMRLFTPVPVLAKVSAKDQELGGSVVPKGTKVMISCVALHSDKEFWGKDVDDFRPERHRRSTMPPKLARNYNYAFMPFSQGPRNCIGRQLALAEAKTILSYMLRDFRLELAPGQTTEPVTDSYMIPLRPEGGCRVSVFRRK